MAKNDVLEPFLVISFRLVENVEIAVNCKKKGKMREVETIFYWSLLSVPNQLTLLSMKWKVDILCLIVMGLFTLAISASFFC